MTVRDFPVDMRITPNPCVQLLTFGDRSALFDELLQQIFELNHTASFIWNGLTRGQTANEVVDELVMSGLGHDVAVSYVDIALNEWLDQGWLLPEDVAAILGGDPTSRLNLRLLDLGFDVKFFGRDIPARVLGPFLHLVGEGPASKEISVVSFDNHYYVHSNRQARGRYDQRNLAPGLKALLTQLLVNVDNGGFFTHGALVGHNGARIFLSGNPGAGKSTLTASLLADGFEAFTDDIVHVNDGAMRGVPFAIALKAGSWPLLADRLPQIGDQPVFQRSDQQDVVYLHQATAPSEHGPIQYFICLHRDAAAEPRLEPMSPLEALQVLLDSAFSSTKAISAAQIRPLASTLNRAACYVLRYAEVDDARRLVRALAEQ
jgi:hypothetical protein